MNKTIGWAIGVVALGVTAFVIAYGWQKGKAKGESLNASGSAPCPVPAKPQIAPGMPKEKVQEIMKKYQYDYQVALNKCAKGGYGVQAGQGKG